MFNLINTYTSVTIPKFFVNLCILFVKYTGNKSTYEILVLNLFVFIPSFNYIGLSFLLITLG